MMYGLYRIASRVLGPVIAIYLNRRMARGKEDPRRFPERKGIASQSRPPGPLVWLHAASVGEALSLLPLVDRLLARKLGVLMTTGTVSSATLMAERLPAGAIHQFVPVDRVAWIRRFLDHWRPDLVLWAESDFWPNILCEIKARRLPLILVQGRVSPRSLDGWKKAPGFIANILGRFDLCLGQTPGDAERLRVLGGGDCRCVGNLKQAVPPLPCDEVELARLRHGVGDRPLWLAASTHSGEEALVGRVHRHLAERFPRLLTVIVPRHPHRGGEIQSELKALGLSARRRSAGDGVDDGVYIADTMGELGLFYRLAPIVFMGKSLCVEGGQNPFEPARLGAAVLFGPRMSNFPDMVPSMLAAKAAETVADEVALTQAVEKLLAAPEILRDRRAAALGWSEAEAGALDAVIGALRPWLEALDARA
ncbi:3-deoxy-D-manno-octulosonic acid transferase [Magnetospirillum sulfuroxidans]|uniref:3-deoxy-D-manno-octulosonic acid transferase n=1 Tax=Magnetospirillum sulfuroxidans TaxID=611300 RepID=A0ABS5IEQ1_9PROT|nr:3-deoxy-D-manno-octulosonic acid transferase [Magnetospirillum sulfuroxidans]MBR9972870.1 3-deoxy-D-manno-octulosonic acid transferase [Magnetospirillum sulfuroxidans]